MAFNETQYFKNFECYIVNVVDKRKRKSPMQSRSSSQKQTTSTNQVVDKAGPKRIEIQHRIIKKPPPITVKNMTNFPQMLNALATANIPADEFQSKLLNNNKIKVNATNAETYRSITALLNNKGVQWYSFEDKQSRDIRVMTKGLHHTINPVDIITHLNQKGLKATNATNKQKWLTAKQKQDRKVKGLQEVVPLDMFIVAFDRETDVDKIYNIKTVMNSKVHIEPLKKNENIPQC